MTVWNNFKTYRSLASVHRWPGPVVLPSLIAEKQHILSKHVPSVIMMTGRVTRAWLLCVTLVTLANCAEKPPNILLIMADDLGIGDIGCFGNDTIRTPHIDKLAADGVKLNHDLATASICTPSRSAFQTGRYPIRMGMVPYDFRRVLMHASAVGGLPGNETTIGELAKSKGYATGFIGKWHLGMNCQTRNDFCHHPVKQGYDYFYGLAMTNNKDYGSTGVNVLDSRFPHAKHAAYGVAIAGLVFAYSMMGQGSVGWRGFAFLVALGCAPIAGINFYEWMMPWTVGIVMRNFDVVEQPIVLPGFTDRLIREGVEFLEERQKDERPFLLIVSWIQVHTTLHAISPFKGRSAHGVYGDEVEEMDWSVGEILNALERLGFAENTFVHFTSDHGGHLEEKDRYGNQAGGWNGIYKGGKAQGGMEGGIRVPSIARWPAVIPAGSVCNVPTSHMDILPTVAKIVGAKLPTDRQIDGVNILPLLRGEPDVKPPHKFLVHYCGDIVHSVRYTPGDGKDVYKAFYATHKFSPGKYECSFVCLCDDYISHDPPLLYNIARDPAEDSALDVRNPLHVDIVKEIDRLLAEHKNGIVPVESQFLAKNFWPRPWLQMCCNMPYCGCQEEVPPPNRS